MTGPYSISALFLSQILAVATQRHWGGVLTLAALVAVTTPARLCSERFSDSTVELKRVSFLFTSFEGESHGRFIPVIGE
jgi:hypothetical protein